MSRRKTLEQFKQEVYEFDNTYEVLGEYINTETDILMKHNCGTEFMAKPFRFLSGVKGCPKCRKRGTKPMTHEQFVNKVERMTDGDYLVIGEFISLKERVRVRHLECGYEYDVLPRKFNKHKGKTKCVGCKSRKTISEFREDVKERVGNEYSVLEVLPFVKGEVTKFKIKHNICDYEYSIDSTSFIEGNRCANCNGNAIKTHEQFVEDVYSLVGNEHTVVGQYINARTKIEIKHNECGGISEISPHAFLSKGTRCIHCKFSKGEKKISDWLKENKICYKPQYIFNDCVHKNTLPFDFGVIKDSKIAILIEFDGRQHFEPIEWYGGNEGFEIQQIRDSIKNEYCKNNSIPLIRIPYWEFDNLENILEKEVLKYI